RQRAVRLELPELGEPGVGPSGVGDVEIPPRIRRRDNAGEAGYRGDRGHLAGRRSRRVRHELAVAAHRHAALTRDIPDVPARRGADVAEGIPEEAAALGQI